MNIEVIKEKISYYRNLADYIRDDDPDSAAEYDAYADFYRDELNKAEE